MSNEKNVPVYLFTGFLEAGKTKFIQETLEDKRFNNGERTLLIVCEEGEEEYAPDKFSGANVFIRTLEDEDDLIEEILLERRKELYGEGYASFDILRTHKGLERTGDHISHSGNKTQPAGSWNLVYQIPVTEITNKRQINAQVWPAGDQNPFDSVLENL